MNNKTLPAIGLIRWALGYIEGLCCGVDKEIADRILYAVKCIDEAMEGVIENGK